MWPSANCQTNWLSTLLWFSSISVYYLSWVFSQCRIDVFLFGCFFFMKWKSSCVLHPASLPHKHWDDPWTEHWCLESGGFYYKRGRWQGGTQGCRRSGGEQDGGVWLGGAGCLNWCDDWMILEHKDTGDRRKSNRQIWPLTIMAGLTTIWWWVDEKLVEINCRLVSLMKGRWRSVRWVLTVQSQCHTHNTHKHRETEADEKTQGTLGRLAVSFIVA